MSRRQKRSPPRGKGAKGGDTTGFDDVDEEGPSLLEHIQDFAYNLGDLLMSCNCTDRKAPGGGGKRMLPADLALIAHDPGVYGMSDLERSSESEGTDVERPVDLALPIGKRRLKNDKSPYGSKDKEGGSSRTDKWGRRWSQKSSLSTTTPQSVAESAPTKERSPSPTSYRSAEGARSRQQQRGSRMPAIGEDSSAKEFAYTKKKARYDENGDRIEDDNELSGSSASSAPASKAKSPKKDRQFFPDGSPPSTTAKPVEPLQGEWKTTWSQQDSLGEGADSSDTGESPSKGRRAMLKPLGGFEGLQTGIMVRGGWHRRYFFISQDLSALRWVKSKVDAERARFAEKQRELSQEFNRAYSDEPSPASRHDSEGTEGGEASGAPGIPLDQVFALLSLVHCFKSRHVFVLVFLHLFAHLVFFGMIEEGSLVGSSNFPKTLSRVYRRLSVQYHPDRGGSDEKQKRLNAAKEELAQTPALCFSRLKVFSGGEVEEICRAVADTADDLKIQSNILTSLTEECMRDDNGQVGRTAAFCKASDLLVSWLLASLIFAIMYQVAIGVYGVRSLLEACWAGLLFLLRCFIDSLVLCCLHFTGRDHSTEEGGDAQGPQEIEHMWLPADAEPPPAPSFAGPISAETYGKQRQSETLNALTGLPTCVAGNLAAEQLQVCWRMQENGQAVAEVRSPEGSVHGETGNHAGPLPTNSRPHKWNGAGPGCTSRCSDFRLLLHRLAVLSAFRWSIAADLPLTRSPDASPNSPVHNVRLRSEDADNVSSDIDLRALGSRR
uniref:J domain-containing protein n=1 Tax=Chromera velia CCMP2878 TaxID=1169474 RepID=A0A0G4F1A9_9ALVE|eukprot:Cvel_14569.t1-p1 / transcript=Cvel_14569.t1 / gene=Cvel_14569 / organism=Chromera_velia_CCMP2878 / gene_product=hypothetical protein / transcript_product=hypothetical protein / location=Cvel_scaffold1041:29317-37823(-) / protein_length=777 / sequence_SO=supercontig / SO=protein_coding / is_pseudo=false